MIRRIWPRTVVCARWPVLRCASSAPRTFACERSGSTRTAFRIHSKSWEQYGRNKDSSPLLSFQYLRRQTKPYTTDFLEGQLGLYQNAGGDDFSYVIDSKVGRRSGEQRDHQPHAFAAPTVKVAEPGKLARYETRVGRFRRLDVRAANQAI